MENLKALQVLEEYRFENGEMDYGEDDAENDYKT